VIALLIAGCGSSAIPSPEAAAVLYAKRMTEVKHAYAGIANIARYTCYDTASKKKNSRMISKGVSEAGLRGMLQNNTLIFALPPFTIPIRKIERGTINKHPKDRWTPQSGSLRLS
jgi:hypothetical protein